MLTQLKPEVELFVNWNYTKSELTLLAKTEIELKFKKYSSHRSVQWNADRCQNDFSDILTAISKQLEQSSVTWCLRACWSCSAPSSTLAAAVSTFASILSTVQRITRLTEWVILINRDQILNRLDQTDKTNVSDVNDVFCN